MYIVAKETITAENTNANNQTNKVLTFRNNKSFRSKTSKINITFIKNAEDLDIVMPMSNLFQYTDNYSMTSEILWNFYTYNMNDYPNERES